MEPRRDRWHLVPSRAWPAALLFGGVAFVVALAADRWQVGVRDAEVRARVRLIASPHADAFRSAVERRFGLLAGFVSFAGSRMSRAELESEFSAYAQGTLAAARGIRSMQFVEHGRITMIWPLAGNERMVDFQLEQIPDSTLQFLSTGQPLVTGPVTLIEGGDGLLLRQAIPPRAGFPDLATIILDVPTLVREAGIPDSAAGIAMEIRRRGSAWFGGDPEGSAVAPESLAIAVFGSEWLLTASPHGGWGAMHNAGAVPFRLGAFAMVMMSALLGFVIGRREEELVREVHSRDSRLEFALRAGRMGVWEWDLRTNRVRCGEAVSALLGFDPSTVPDPDRRFFAALHPEDRFRVQGVLEASRRGEPVDHMLECRVIAADGSERWILSISGLERDEANRPARIFGVLSDSSERRELEERLRHSQRLESIGKLAGGISHDFNNLLTALIGFTELAGHEAEALGDDPRAQSIRRDLAQVLSTANRAASLTGQLLAFSRRGVTLPQRLCMNAVIRDLEPMLRRVLSAEIEFVTDFADNLPHVLIDSGQLTQVVLNLVVNSRDAMPAGGTITIRTSLLAADGALRPVGAPPGEWVTLSVADSGVGMPESVRARIFEPYFTTKEMGRGTGLGLAVVHGAIEHARGTVTVQSEEGKGSCFRVYLAPHRDER